MEATIREFLWASIDNTLDEFDFDSAFAEFESYLMEFVISHAQGTFEEFLQYYDDLYGSNYMECEVPKWAIVDTPWCQFTDVDVVEAIMKAKYERVHNSFKDTVHGDLADLRERIQNTSKLSLPQLVELFDECIHAEHCSGNILEDVDIDELKAEIDEEWKEQQKSNTPEFPTEIRKFLQQT